jgi:hypothetical protein
MVLTPYHVVRNADGTCLIICGSTSKSFGRIQAVTPSDIYSWAGPDVPLTQSSERTGIENKWFALTGRVVELRAEADGDLHIALQDATGDKPGIVVVEVPAKPK